MEDSTKVKTKVKELDKKNTGIWGTEDPEDYIHYPEYNKHYMGAHSRLKAFLSWIKRRARAA